MSNTKTFYAYKIINETLGLAHSPLKDHLCTKLRSDADCFRNRCKPIIQNSTTEDVLASFLPINTNNPYIGGEMWRIAPSKDMPKIPQSLFERESVTADEVPEDPTVSPTDKSRTDTHYFIVTEDRLITTFPISRIQQFAKYLNSLLTVYRGDIEYKFEPLIMLPTNVALSDITSIVFSDRPIYENGRLKKGNSKYHLFKVGINNLKALFDDFGSTKDLIDQKILSATMTIKLSRPSKMTDEIYKQRLSALLKPLSADDVDGVSFKLSNGEKIKAMTIHAKTNHSFNPEVESERENIRNACTAMYEYYQTLQRQ